MKGVPILMYHAIEDREHPAGMKDAGDQLYVLKLAQFREQMGYLHKEGFRTFLLEELVSDRKLPEKVVVLTFDDGHESNYTLALPVLQEFGFKAVFFITTGWIGKPNYINKDQIRALYEAGMEIGSHCITHRYLSDLEDSEVEEELSGSKETLERIIDNEITSISYPGGRMSGVEDKVVTRYDIVCCSRPGRYRNSGSRYSIPRVALQNTMSIFKFVSIMSSGTGLSERVRYRTLAVLKSVLGNRLYEIIRGVLIHSSGSCGIRKS